MKSNIRDRIMAIAQAARRWAEDNRPECWPTNLEMMCARASGELFKKLKRAGFDPEMVFLQYHAFVVCEDFIIDVTATQFNRDAGDGLQYNRVEIVPYEVGRKDSVWSGTIKVRTRDLAEARAFQVQANWPKGQWVLA